MMLTALSYGIIGTLLILECLRKRRYRCRPLAPVTADELLRLPEWHPGHIYWFVFLLGLLALLAFPCHRPFAWTCMLSGFAMAGRTTMRYVLLFAFRYRLLLQPSAMALCVLGARYADMLAPAVILTMLDQTAACTLQQRERKE